MSPLQSVERELTDNAASLRALARQLVGRDAADDLVQETALRALRSPPPRPHGLGAWLATILRRLASSHRRSTLRRLHRERVAAAAEALPAADTSAARRDVLRALTAALFGLPEPYQSTLLLRYFEGLPPKAIAARQGVPLPTIKSRLQRGLALLRDALDRRDRGGSWRQALARATGLAAPTAALSVTFGALLMANSLKLATVATGLLVGVAVFWQLGSDPGAPQPARAAQQTAPATDIAAARTGARRTADAGREVVTAEPFPGIDLAHPHAFSLRCTVVDDHGLPVQDASVSFAPVGCERNEWPERTGADGSVLLQWNGRAPRQRIQLAVGRAIARELDVRAGDSRAIVMVDQREQVDLALWAAGGEQRGTFTISAHVEGQRPGDLTTRLFRNLSAGGATLSPQHGMHPEQLFADRIVARPASGEAELSMLSAVSLVSGTYDVQFDLRDLAIATAATPGNDATGTIAGMVFGEDGKPCAGELVVYGTEPARPIERTTSGPNGTFRFTGVALGPKLVRAGGGPDGLASSTVLVVENGDSPVQLNLRREQTIRGTACGDAGVPLTEWWIDYEALDGSWADRTQVAADGTFVLANLPARPGRVWLHQDPNGLPAAVLPSVLPDSGPVAFDLGGDKAPSGSVQLRLPARDADDSRSVTVRAWQQDSGFGADLAQTDDGAMVRRNLPAGFYRLEVGVEELGWVDLGQHYVDGRGPLDLGSVRLPVPGVLRLLDRPAGTTVELCQRRPDCDVRALQDPGARDELPLPAGRWLVFWQTEGRAPRVREVTLGSGAVTAVSLADR